MGKRICLLALVLFAAGAGAVAPLLASDDLQEKPPGVSDLDQQKTRGAAASSLTPPGADRHPYTFSLSRGAGTPVCEALLQRLNATTYKVPPYCGIPENNTVPGFSSLSRKSLSYAEGRKSYPSIEVFSSGGGRPLIGEEPPGEQYLWDTRYRGSGDWYAVPAWRYPSLDIENNGAPDDVILWQGISDTVTASCGKFDPDINDFERVSQEAFVMRAGGLRVDDVKTRNIFYRPPIRIDLGSSQIDSYMPIGLTVDFFKYRGVVYYGGFYNAYAGINGDFEGAHKWNESSRITPSTGLANSFDLFERKDGATRLVCGYKMTSK